MKSEITFLFLSCLITNLVDEFTKYWIELLFVLVASICVYIVHKKKIGNRGLLGFILASIILAPILGTLVHGFHQDNPKFLLVNCLFLVVVLFYYIPIQFKEEFPTIEREIIVKLVGGRITQGPIEEQVLNSPVSKQIYPLITGEVSTIITRTEETEPFDSDILPYLFVKFMHSVFHDGWFLLHKEPAIDLASGHGSYFEEEEVDNSNKLTFDELPDNIRNNSLFQNPMLFSDHAFRCSSHSVFPPCEDRLQITLPPGTKMTFGDTETRSAMLTFDNDYFTLTMQLGCSGIKSGLPMYYVYSFDIQRFENARTLIHYVSIVAKFTPTFKVEVAKQYRRWVETLLRQFEVYFGWQEFMKSQTA